METEGFVYGWVLFSIWLGWGGLGSIRCVRGMIKWMGGDEWDVVFLFLGSDVVVWWRWCKLSLLIGGLFILVIHYFFFFLETFGAAIVMCAGCGLVCELYFYFLFLGGASVWRLGLLTCWWD